MLPRHFLFVNSRKLTNRSRLCATKLAVIYFECSELFSSIFAHFITRQTHEICFPLHMIHTIKCIYNDSNILSHLQFNHKQNSFAFAPTGSEKAHLASLIRQEIWSMLARSERKVSSGGTKYVNFQLEMIGRNMKIRQTFESSARVHIWYFDFPISWIETKWCTQRCSLLVFHSVSAIEFNCHSMQMTVNK